MPWSPIFFAIIWNGFKNKIDVCHVLCKELLLLDVTHSEVDIETELAV